MLEITYCLKNKSEEHWAIPFFLFFCFQTGDELFHRGYKTIFHGDRPKLEKNKVLTVESFIKG